MNEKECRLCFERPTKLCNVFENNVKGVSLAEKVNISFGVNITAEDQVSKNICEHCAFLSRAVYEFRVSAQKRDKMKKILQKDSENNNDDENMKKKTKENPLGPKLANSSVTFAMINDNNGIHSTAKDILRNNPGLKLPVACLKENMLPKVFMRSCEDTIFLADTLRNGMLSKVVDLNYAKNNSLCLTFEMIKNNNDIHPSIKDILLNNPTLRLPQPCGDQNMLPCISVNMFKREDYFTCEMNRNDIHSTIKDILRENPTLKIPESCANLNMLPHVVIETCHEIIAKEGKQFNGMLP